MPTVLKPLSTYMISPVMPAARSEHRNVGGVAHVLERDVAAERRDLGDVVQHLAKPADAGGRERLDRAGGDAVDADALRPEVGGQEAHVGLEARLGEAHDVVVRDRAHRAEVRQRQHRAVAPGMSGARARASAVKL